jgi:hypothetical protein
MVLNPTDLKMNGSQYEESSESSSVFNSSSNFSQESKIQFKGAGGGSSGAEVITNASGSFISPSKIAGIMRRFPVQQHQYDIKEGEEC